MPLERDENARRSQLRHHIIPSADRSGTTWRPRFVRLCPARCLRGTSWNTTCRASSDAAVPCQLACVFAVRYRLVRYRLVIADLGTLAPQVISVPNVLASLLDIAFCTRIAADTSFLGSNRLYKECMLVGCSSRWSLYRPAFERHSNAICTVKRREQETGKTCAATSFGGRSNTLTIQLKIAVYASCGCKLVSSSGIKLELGSCSIYLRLTGNWGTLFGMPQDKAEATTRKCNQPLSDNSTILL
jgi:hypothetical protein